MVLDSENNREGRAESQLHDPNPNRKKYLIELLYKFLSRSVSYAQLTGIPAKDLYSLSEMGRVKLQHGRTEEALAIFECLVKIDEKNPYYHAALGCAYQKKQRFVDAVYEYTEALKGKKDDLASIVNRGEIYLMHKNFRKAAEDFRTAILFDPEGKNKYSNRARSLVVAIKRNLQVQKEKISKTKGRVPRKRIPKNQTPQLGSE